jgi:hypothetical protein
MLCLSQKNSNILVLSREECEPTLNSIATSYYTAGTFVLHHLDHLIYISHTHIAYNDFS